MTQFDATEAAYKNGYNDGQADAVKSGYAYLIESSNISKSRKITYSRLPNLLRGSYYCLNETPACLNCPFVDRMLAEGIVICQRKLKQSINKYLVTLTDK